LGRRVNSRRAFVAEFRKTMRAHEGLPLVRVRPLAFAAAPVLMGVVALVMPVSEPSPLRKDPVGRPAAIPADPAAASRGESEKASRTRWPEPARVTLRREVSTSAAAAANERDFFACLRHAGVLVRTRSSARNPGQITGYAVALAADTARTGGPVWYRGGKLAADLTLPKLRHRWRYPTASTEQSGQLTWTANPARPT
jgi:hypothetical protein